MLGQSLGAGHEPRVAHASAVAGDCGSDRAVAFCPGDRAAAVAHTSPQGGLGSRLRERREGGRVRTLPRRPGRRELRTPRLGGLGSRLRERQANGRLRILPRRPVAASCARLAGLGGLGSRLRERQARWSAAHSAPATGPPAAHPNRLTAPGPAHRRGRRPPASPTPHRSAGPGPPRPPVRRGRHRPHGAGSGRSPATRAVHRRRRAR